MTWHKFPDEKPEEDLTVIFLLKTIIAHRWFDDGDDLWGFVHTTGSWSAKEGVKVDCFRRNCPGDACYLADMVILYWCTLPTDPIDLPPQGSSY